MPPAPLALGSLLQRFLRPPAHVQVANVDDATWRLVIGAGLVKRAIPMRLREGVLTVRVASSAWAQQLSMLRDELRAKLGQHGYKINDIRFSVGPVLPTRRLLGAPIFVPCLRPEVLPPSLEMAIAHVPDPALRLTLARAASANLAWQRSFVVAPPMHSPLPGLLPPEAMRPELTRPPPTRPEAPRRDGPSRR